MHITFQIVAMFLIGFGARRFIPEPTTLVKWINYFIIYLSLPSIILLKVPQLQFNYQVLIPALTAWAWVLVGAIITLVFCRYFKVARATEGALLLLVTMGNVSFLGYPMVSAYFGDAALVYAIFYDQLGGFLTLSTFGFIVVAIYTPKRELLSQVGDIAVSEKTLIAEDSLPVEDSLPADGSLAADGSLISVNQVVKRVLCFPPFITLLIAFFLPVEVFVGFIEPFLVVLGYLLMPMALFVLGVQFQPQLLPEHKLPLCVGIALKMLLAPALALFIVGALGANDDVRNATVLEAAMPSMVTPGLMAISAGIAPRFVATMLGYCTVVGFVTLPILALYLKS